MSDGSVLAKMSIEQRDDLIAQVWTFLTERGYTITAPGAVATCETPGCRMSVCCASCAGVQPERGGA